MQEPRTGSTGTLVAITHAQKSETQTTIRRWIMHKNSALLSIGATLLCSLFFVDVGHAFQTDRKMDARILTAAKTKGTANLSTTQASIAPNPCTDGGKGRTGAAGTKRCLQGSGEQTTDGDRYTRQASTTPTPCAEGGKGRTGAPSKKRCPIESGDQAADGSFYTSTTMLR